MIKDTDNEYGRWRQLALQIRGRDLSREEFRESAVGLTWLRAMEILSDDTEAAQNVQDAALGRQARVENWASLTDAQTRLKRIREDLGIK